MHEKEVLNLLNESDALSALIETASDEYPKVIRNYLVKADKNLTDRILEDTMKMKAEGHDCNLLAKIKTLFAIQIIICSKKQYRNRHDYRSLISDVFKVHNTPQKYMEWVESFLNKEDGFFRNYASEDKRYCFVVCSIPDDFKFNSQED